MSFPRRTVEELVAIYSLEHSLRDVFVEGPTDKSFLRWFLDQSGIRFPVIYEIDDIDIPNNVVMALGLDNGKRGRVIALAHTLEEKSGGPTPQASCIADRDLDRFLGRNYSCDQLLFSDYTSIEMYVCSVSATEKFVRLYCRKTSIEPSRILKSIVKIAEHLFAIRVALTRLNLRCRWVSLERSLAIKSGELVFDIESFVHRLLSSGGCHSAKEALLVAKEECRAEFGSDSRNQMHGHDFVRTFAFYFRKKFGDNQLFSEKVVARSLLLCVDESTLRTEPLFRQLIARVAN